MTSETERGLEAWISTGGSGCKSPEPCPCTFHIIADLFATLKELRQEHERLKEERDFIDKDRDLAVDRLDKCELRRDSLSRLIEGYSEYKQKHRDIAAELDKVKAELAKSKEFNLKIIDEACACDQDGNNVKDPCEMHRKWMEAALATSAKQLKVAREALEHLVTTIRNNGSQFDAVTEMGTENFMECEKALAEIDKMEKG